MTNNVLEVLANEAEDYADDEFDRCGAYFHPTYTAKLAELIVRECARVAQEAAEYADIKMMTYTQVEENVLNHFGFKNHE